METLDILLSNLGIFSVGFIGGVFLAYIAKIVQALWTSSTKFF